MNTRPHPLAVAILAALTLSACSDSGSGADSAATSPAAVAPEAATPAAEGVWVHPVTPWGELWRAHGVEVIAVFHAALLARWVVLSQVWRDWDEPNASVRTGSTLADDVLEADFCEVVDNGRFRLLRRCEGLGGRPEAAGGTN